MRWPWSKAEPTATSAPPPTDEELLALIRQLTDSHVRHGVMVAVRDGLGRDLQFALRTGQTAEAQRLKASYHKYQQQTADEIFRLELEIDCLKRIIRERAADSAS